jgi:heat shock protein HslJ
VLLGLALVSGCTTPGATGPAQDPAALEGATWLLTGTSVADVDPTQLGITAEFASGTMSGFSGVNSYSGPYEAKDDGTFSAGPLAGTLMAGPEPLMKAEQTYLKLVDDAKSFAIADSTLTLTSTDGSTLTFEKAEPFDLSGTSWKITGYNNGKEAVTSPEADSELTLEFGTDGTVSGNGGVNQFNGPYEATEDTIKIGPLASTKMAGPENLMTQEAAYLAALEAGTTWEVVNGVLTTRDAGGAMQINAVAK